jgi:hypothetical protein
MGRTCKRHVRPISSFNIKIDLRVIGLEVVDWIRLAEC